MNWYKNKKIADIYEDLNKFGPEGKEYASEPSEEELNFWNSDLTRPWLRRNRYIKEYGWGVPDKEAIEKIKIFVEQGNVLEIGSGYGLWAKLMRDEGISVTATDLGVIERQNEKYYKPESKRFTDIEKMDHLDAIEKYGHFDTLMMVWPPCGSPMAYEALAFFEGNKLILVGEWKGCTANDQFYNLLDSEWKEIEKIYIPHWEEVKDDLTLWIRK